jgi:broad specificity phosphatase PhoE
VPDLRVWCSQKIRAVQTASLLHDKASYWECWKALDEIDAVGQVLCTNMTSRFVQGICEGLTYEEIAQRYPQQFDNRDMDKYHYRYP